jgi:hypothetical protein
VIPVRLSAVTAAAVLLALIGNACGSSSVSVTSPSASKCEVATENSMASVPAGGAAGTITVTTTRDCTWAASTSASWVVITSGTNGQGSGALGYRVAANTDAAPRRTTVDVNSSKVDIAQEPAQCRFTVAPSTVTMGCGGGSATVSIEASLASCSWNAATDAGWIHVQTPAGSGNASLKLNIDANGGAARSAPVVIANQQVTVTQSDAAGPPPAPPPPPSTPACTYSISPSDASVAASGGTGSVAVTAGTACAWSASTNASWISLTSGLSGTGNGAVAFRAASNSGGPRSGTITIADHVFTVTQAAASCSFAINPTSQSAPVGGGTINVSVALATGSSCGWTATSAVDWLTIASVRNDPGGGGSVVLTAAANSGPARSGKASIAGQMLTVSQGSGCSYSIAPGSQAFGSSGGPGSVAVTASADACTWSASSGAGWITVGSGSGHGSNPLGFTVAANTDMSPRTGTLTIAGRTFTVTQEAAPAPCMFTVSPPGLTLPYTSGSGSFTVTASAPTCAWTAAVNGAGGWLTLSTPGGTGSGTVTANVVANPGGERTVPVTIANQSVAVTQSAAPPPPPCTFTMAPPAPLPAAGGGASIGITASDASCTWSAIVTAGGDWLSITGPASGSGSGSISVSAPPNSGSERAGTVTVAGQPVSVTQAAGMVSPPPNP